MSNRNEQSGHNLTDRQRRVIPIILSCKTIVTGCRKARLSRTTLYEWLKQPEFKKAFEVESRETVEEALRALKMLANDSVNVLSRLLRARSESVRYRTATAIIENLLRSRDQDELESRLAQLEQSVQDTRNDF